MFLVQGGFLADGGIFPGPDVGEVLVVALGLADPGLAVLDLLVGGGELEVGAEVAAARLVAVQGVVTEDLGKLEEVGDPPGLFEFGVEVVG